MGNGTLTRNVCDFFFDAGLHSLRDQRRQERVARVGCFGAVGRKSLLPISLVISIPPCWLWPPICFRGPDGENCLIELLQLFIARAYGGFDGRIHRLLQFLGSLPCDREFSVIISAVEADFPERFLRFLGFLPPRKVSLLLFQLVPGFPVGLTEALPVVPFGVLAGFRIRYNRAARHHREEGKDAHVHQPPLFLVTTHAGSPFFRIPKA